MSNENPIAQMPLSMYTIPSLEGGKEHIPSRKNIMILGKSLTLHVQFSWHNRLIILPIVEPIEDSRIWFV